MTDSEAQSPLMAATQAAIDELPGRLHALRCACEHLDPVELLAKLAVRRQLRADALPVDGEEFVFWQVRLEYLAWLLGSNVWPAEVVQVDCSRLVQVETTLEQFFSAAAMARLHDDDGDSGRLALRSAVRNDAIHVRGDAPPGVARFLAEALYAPHDSWFLEHLGFTISDALAVMDGIATLISERLRHAIGRALGAQASADHVATWLEAAPEAWGALGFTAEELAASAVGTTRERVDACLERLAVEFGALPGEPDVLAFNPLVRTPLLVRDSVYWTFVPALLQEALLTTFHFDLLNDGKYLPVYDAARARWLELATVESFRFVWPDAVIGTNLKYGTKKNAAEIDAVVFHDGVLILVECKWKALTLLARMGSLEALHIDVKKALNDAINQAVRARDYVNSCEADVVFRACDGHHILIPRGSITEVFLVGVTGRGSLSVLAANPSVAKPLGLLQVSPPPWLVSLSDLMTVCRTMEFRGQLVDYLRRRAEVLAVGRIHVHDEWDMLGLYFSGALDVHDPEFAKIDFVSFTTAGDGLERALLSNGQNVPDDARRRIGPRIRQLLHFIEGEAISGKTDLVATVLALSDRQLAEVEAAWVATEQRTLADGEQHDAAAYAAQRKTGFTVVTGLGHLADTSETMAALALLKKYECRATTWIGIASDPKHPSGPFGVFLDQAEWQHDPVLEVALSSREPRKTRPPA